MSRVLAVYWCNDVSIHYAKNRIMESMVFPIVLYYSECWTGIEKRTEGKLMPLNRVA